MGQGPNHYQGFLPLVLQSHLSSRNICLTSSINTQLLIVLTICKKTGALMLIISIWIKKKLLLELIIVGVVKRCRAAGAAAPWGERG